MRNRNASHILRLLYCILALAGTGASTYAAGLHQLEDVTVRVLDINEVPNANVELIELPEPDLGELHDRVESISLPGRPVFENQVVDTQKTPGAENAGTSAPPAPAESSSVAPANPDQK